MFRLKSDISVNSQSGKTIRFKAVVDVKITTSIHTLTDTCVITLPRRFSWRKDNITNHLKRGDEITINLGYGVNLKQVFKGFLKDVKNGRPIVLECENEAWKLKQMSVPVFYRKTLTLQQFCNDFMPEIECVVDDVNLGETRVTEVTNAAQVLDYFRKNFPINFFFRDGKFYGSLPLTQLFADGGVSTHKFKFGKNIIKDNLKYTAADDVKIQVVTKVILKNNTKLEVKLPAKNNGEGIRTFLCPNATSKADLETQAQHYLDNFKVDRMDGSYTAFGEPFVQKGDFVQLYDDDYTERDAKKFITDAVTYRFGRSGYRQEIKLGAQIR